MRSSVSRSADTWRTVPDRMGVVRWENAVRRTWAGRSGYTVSMSVGSTWTSMTSSPPAGTMSISGSPCPITPPRVNTRRFTTVPATGAATRVRENTLRAAAIRSRRSDIRVSTSRSSATTSVRRWLASSTIVRRVSPTRCSTRAIRARLRARPPATSAFLRASASSRGLPSNPRSISPRRPSISSSSSSVCRSWATISSSSPVASSRNCPIRCR